MLYGHHQIVDVSVANCVEIITHNFDNLPEFCALNILPVKIMKSSLTENPNRLCTVLQQNGKPKYSNTL